MLPLRLLPADVASYLQEREIFRQQAEAIGGSGQTQTLEAALLRLLSKLNGKVPYGDPTWFHAMAYPATSWWKGYTATPIPIELQAPAEKGKNHEGWTMRFRVKGRAHAQDAGAPGKNRLELVPTAGHSIWRRSGRKRAEKRLFLTQELWEPVGDPAHPSLPFHIHPDAAMVYHALPEELWGSAIDTWVFNSPLSLYQAIQQVNV